jgi:SAM-dependent methyltransferase
VKDGTQLEISPKDTMYEGNLKHYISVGQSALHCIKTAMAAAGDQNVRNVRSILDFGSGYGRVLRVLKTEFPKADLTACDISREAVDFCAITFGATPVLSSENSSDIRFNRKFDLIWCGTLLTQFDAPGFSEFLQLFRSLLSTRGLLVFTTHGPFVAMRLRTHGLDYGMNETSVSTMLQSYESLGFGYADYPTEILPQVGVKKYGVCVSKPSWVCRQIESLTSTRLVNYTERAWDNHQDSVACTNE